MSNYILETPGSVMPFTMDNLLIDRSFIIGRNIELTKNVALSVSEAYVSLHLYDRQISFFIISRESGNIHLSILTNDNVMVFGNKPNKGYRIKSTRISDTIKNMSNSNIIDLLLSLNELARFISRRTHKFRYYDNNRFIVKDDIEFIRSVFDNIGFYEVTDDEYNKVFMEYNLIK